MATETKTETLDCGCEWQIDIPELATRCTAPCSSHPKDRGRQGLLPKPLPAGFMFIEWIAKNVRRYPGAGVGSASR